MVSLVDDQIGKLFRSEFIQLVHDTLDRRDEVVRIRFVRTTIIPPCFSLRPQPLKLTLGLRYQVAAMHEPQGPPTEPPRVRDRRHRLAGPGRMFQQGYGLPLGPHSLECPQRVLLVLAQLQQLARLAGQKVVERQKPRQALQEEGQLLLDALRFMGNLAIRPAKHAPPLMYKTILT